MGFIDGISSRGFNLIAERSENVMNLTCFFTRNTWRERVESIRGLFKHDYDWADKFIQTLISTIFRHGQWRCWCIQCLWYPCYPCHVTTVHKRELSLRIMPHLSIKSLPISLFDILFSIRIIHGFFPIRIIRWITTVIPSKVFQLSKSVKQVTVHS